MDSPISVRKKGAFVEVSIEDPDSIESPELKEPILWRELGELYRRNLIPLSFQILSFKLRETALYNMARYIAGNYSRIRPLYRALKSAMNNRPVIVEVPGEIKDEATINTFVEKLKQLGSSTGIISGIDYIRGSRIIRIENVQDAGFLLGGWLEIALSDAISSTCPFREFLLLKNLRFRFKNVNNEIDILLITEKGSLIFEAKSGFDVRDTGDICYKLLRKASLLDIPSSRAFLLIPSLDDVKEGITLEKLDSKCFGIRVLTLENMRGELEKLFYNMTPGGV